MKVNGNLRFLSVADESMEIFLEKKSGILNFDAIR